MLVRNSADRGSVAKNNFAIYDNISLKDYAEQCSAVLQSLLVTVTKVFGHIQAKHTISNIVIVPIFIKKIVKGKSKRELRTEGR